jgi:hypothetical protein
MGKLLASSSRQPVGILIKKMVHNCSLNNNTENMYYRGITSNGNFLRTGTPIKQ